MADLKGFKDYARLEDDDTTAAPFFSAAVNYVANAGVTDSSHSELYDLLVYMIALHWYENRGMVQSTTLTPIPMAATSIIIQLRDDNL